MKTTKLFFSILMILFVINTNATIVYTDINPDGLPTGGGFDFNGDGVNEINCTNAFYMTYPAGSDIWAFGLPPGQGTGWDVPKPLAANTVIDTNGNFLCQVSYGGDCNISGVTTNPFASMVNQDRFLGVKMRFNGHGQPHYGWIRVVWDGTTFTYKDFAYETIPNKAIKAGYKTTGIESPKQDFSFSIFPNPASKSIYVNLNTSVNISKIKIYSILGEEVKEINIYNRKRLKIDVSKLKKGGYFISIMNKGQIIENKKLIING
jgi:hypothetical protein